MNADPAHLSLTLRDMIYFGSLIVSLTLGYGKMRSEIRHLEDVKADRSEVQRLAVEIRQRLADIQTSLVRLEQNTRQHKPTEPRP